MAKDAKFKIIFEGDANSAKRALGEVEQGVAKSASAFDKGFKQMAKAGKFALLGVGAAVAVAGPKLFSMGKEMELLGKKAETVFGDQLGTVQAWAKQSASAMGLTEAKAVGLAANFADLLIPMGFARDEAAAMSTNVVGLSGALSEWSNGQFSAAEASDILAKAMLGEREGLKALGISITEADVQQRLLEKGQKDLTGAALQQAKAIATQELIFENSTDAQAAFAEGGDSLARQQTKLKATLDTTKEQLATALIPVFKTVISVVSEVIAWFKQHEDIAKILAITVGVVLTAAIGAYIVSMAGAAAATIAATWPILVIIAAIAGLVAGAMFLKRNWSTIWGQIKEVAASAASWVVARLQPIIGVFDGIGRAIASVIRWFQRVIDKIRSIRLPSWLWPTHSPSPLELSLRGIASAMKDVRTAGDMRIGAGLTPRFAGGIGGGSPRTANIIVNLDGRTIARAIGQPLVDEIRVKTAHRR